MANKSKGFCIITVIVFGLASMVSPVFAAAKKIDKAASSYEKNIEKAEQKACNTGLGKSAKALSNSCTKAVKALDKRYNSFSEDIKADSRIVSLKKRHDTLGGMLQGLAHQASVEEVARGYRLKIERMETKTCAKRDSYGSRDHELCREDLEKADNIKARIPVDMLEETAIKDLMARHEALRSMPEHMAGVAKAADDKFMHGVALRGSFDNTIHDISYWHRLEDGKANKPADIGYVKGLKKDLPAIRQFAADCKGKYAEFIKDNPQRQAQCELAENADKYYAQFAAASYKVFLTEEIKAVNTVISRLEDPNDRYIEIADYKTYVLGAKDYVADVEKQVSESHRLAGLSQPSYEEFEAAVAKVPVALKAAAAKNRWADKKTVSVSGAIEKRTEQVVEKMGMKLVKVGRKDEPWTLVKNELGIPLYKGAKGWVMIKAPKESFCRMHYTSFTRTYDGNGYAPASNVSMVPVFVPAPCK